MNLITGCGSPSLARVAGPAQPRPQPRPFRTVAAPATLLGRPQSCPSGVL